jgi:hypothetical protein
MNLEVQATAFNRMRGMNKYEVFKATDFGEDGQVALNYLSS